ncbi:23S rRNA (guanosine(2251)-2'-O)-methyltransferase RlmB [Neglectibacter timonensis]|uniref:23S rRNA (guanosine(2251)-2'-O)-methyltransferase RlmB n=1 Tax=Neglectibacter timonensis TaxID=1776382 RepID=UPI00266B6B04|nr:23S rRNA (guanosine(2251)-2'-O)-methyltransferase RlmB [Neglectibacter timonensis]
MEKKKDSKSPVRDDTDSRGNDLIAGRNAVSEALRAGRSIDRLYVQRGEKNGSLLTLIAKAKAAGAAVKETDSRKLDQLCGGAVHQGVVAVAAVKEYAQVEDIFALAADRGEPPFLIVCDELEDPHNLGAVIRTAECAGAHGVIIPKRRSVGLTYAVGKASAGAVEHLPVARVQNLPSLLDELKEKGVWVYAADMDGTPWCETDFTGPVALVIGSEGSGVGRLVKEKSDFVISLPMKGRINSLNASVAAGILCYEVSRQRSGLKAVNP